MSELVRVSVDPFLGLGDLEDDNVLLHKVITALTLARNSVPAEYRDGSIFKMDRDCDYETGYGAPTFTVEYWRPETSEEIARREAESAMIIDLSDEDRHFIATALFERVKALLWAVGGSMPSGDPLVKGADFDRSEAYRCRYLADMISPNAKKEDEGK